MYSFFRVMRRWWRLDHFEHLSSVRGYTNVKVHIVMTLQISLSEKSFNIIERFMHTEKLYQCCTHVISLLLPTPNFAAS